MKIRLRNLLLFLIAGLLNLSFTARGRADESKNHYQDARTGVEIVCDVDKEMFPAEWYAPPVSVKVTPLDVPRIESVLRILLTGLTKYPADMLRKDLRRIYVVQQLSYYNTVVGGFGSPTQKRLYLSHQENWGVYSEAYINAYLETELHHEFAHVLLANHPGQFSRARWQALNPPGFQYGKGGLDAVNKGQYSMEDAAKYWKQGFANKYAVADYDEDVASTCEYLFAGNPLFWQAVGQNAILRQKVAMLAAFYHALDSSFTLDHFQHLPASASANTPNTLPLPIPLAQFSPGDLVAFTGGGWITLPGNPPRLIRAYPGEAGIYPPGGSFVLNIGSSVKPAAPSSAQSQTSQSPPALPSGYSSFWTPDIGWLIYPAARGLQMKTGTLHLHYQPGDTLFFPNGGFIYLPGKGEPLPVAKGHSEVYPAGAVIIFNATPV